MSVPQSTDELRDRLHAEIVQHRSEAERAGNTELLEALESCAREVQEAETYEELIDAGAGIAAVVFMDRF